MVTAYIPVGGAAADPALIQSKLILPGPGAAVNIQVSYDAPVTAGSLLVVLIVTRSTAGPFGGPAGWSSLGTINANGFNGGSGALFYKTADGSEGVGPFTFNRALGTQGRIVLAEFSGPDLLADSAQNDGATSTGSLALGAVDPTSGAPSLLLAAVLNGTTITGVGGYTNVSNGAVEGGVNGPFSQLAYKVANPASGSYSATMTGGALGLAGSDHLAFSGDAGGFVWTLAPETVDDSDASSDVVEATALAAASDVFWRADLEADLPIGHLRALLGFENSGDATILVQGGDASDWSDAATIVSITIDATGSFTEDELDLIWDAATHRYWRLVLDTASQDIEVFEVTFGEGSEVSVPEPGKAILEIYVHDEDASRWGIATWATGPATGTEGIWSAAGWTDITPEGVLIHAIGGSRRPSRGILHTQDGASWNVQTYDPERILDPGNFDSPYYPQLVAGLPIRFSHDSTVIRTGYVDEMSYNHRAPYYQGQILATDTIALLHKASVPADSILGDTLLERIQDAINSAGISVGGIPLPPGGPAGPALAEWVEGAATDEGTSVWKIIQDACLEVLWVPFVTADAGLGLRPWGSPLDRGREIGSPNLEDLRSFINEDGVYSVARVQVEDPDLDPIERVAAPLPRYGRRLLDRREPTIDAEGWATSVLAERSWPGVQYVPGTVHCFSAADVEYFGTIETMERVTITTQDVSVQGRVLGSEVFVEHRGSVERGATWQFVFAVATEGATAIGLTTLVSDQSGEPLLDDMTDTDFLEAD